MEWIDMDSFGSECPSNWEMIADFLNEYIDQKIAESDEDVNPYEVSEKVWEQWCMGEIPDCPVAEFLWYAVMMDREDDWSTGSNFLDEAIRMARNLKADYPETLIAVIDDHTSNPICIGEILEF